MSLRDWFANIGAYRKTKKRTGDISDITHLDLKGGMYSIPDEQYRTFLMELISSVQARGEIHYLVEMPTEEGYPLYCELDLEVKIQSGDIDWIEIRKSILEPMAKFIHEIYPDRELDDLLMIVSRADPKPLDGGYTKIGLHMNWPCITVTRGIGWNIRHKMMDWMHENIVLPKEWEVKDAWNKIIDPTVWTQNGLRMIWAHKAQKCDQCKKPGTSCDKCGGSKKIDAGRPYIVCDVVSMMGMEWDKDILSKLKADYELQLRMTSIRKVCPRVSNREEMSIPAFMNSMTYKPIPLGEGEKRKSRKPATIRDTGIFDSNPNHVRDHHRLKLGDMCFDRLIPLDYSDLRYQLIIRDMQENFGVTAVKVKRNTKSDIYLVTTKSKYCSNKKAEHTSSTVYYIYSQTGVSQRCFSQKPIVYPESNATCSNYKGPWIPHKNRELVEQIFTVPEEDKKIQAAVNVRASWDEICRLVDEKRGIK
jgi:hypothetical protein